jgi:hypothetical protein
MRQASWIAFLLLTLGVVTYEASLEQDAQKPTEEVAIDGGYGFPGGGPKP